MKIDAHQHFWRHDPAVHTWMDDRMETLQRDYLPQDLSPLLEKEGIGGCVAVQADSSTRENDFLLQLADANQWILGVVGWVDLQSPQLSEQLDRWCPHPRAVGVRHIVQDEPDDRFLDGEAFRQGSGRWPSAARATTCSSMNGSYRRPSSSYRRSRKYRWCSITSPNHESEKER